MKETKTKGGKRRRLNLPESAKVLRKPTQERLYYAKDEVGNKIVNIPLNNTGQLAYDKIEIEDEGKIYKGWHRLRKVLLEDDRGFHLRLVLE